MTIENMKTFRQDNFKEVVIPDDPQDLLKWTEVDQRIVDTMKGNGYRKLYRIDRFARRFYCKHARLGQLRMDKKAARRKARRADDATD